MHYVKPVGAFSFGRKMAFRWKSDVEIRFEDGLPSAVNWVRFRDDGQLEVEYYDVSEPAKSATGW